jgi:hypothetical protein
VNNVKPSIAFDTAPDSADEGETKTYTYSYSDPAGVNDTITVTETCGANGTKTDTVAANSFDCTFPDGPNSSTVKVTANDEDPGAATEATQLVTINNVDPTVTLDATNTYEFGESTTAERTFTYTATDPGADTLTPTADCGTGGDLVGGSLDADSFKCIFDDGPATPTISITVDDGDGGTDSDTHGVTVNNVKPSVSFDSAPAIANEGQTKTYTYSYSDPAGANDTITVTESCGLNGTRTDTAAANSFDCTFPDGPASSTVKVTANDEDPGAATEATQVVTIANVDPSIVGFIITGDDGVACTSNDVTVSFTVDDPASETADPITGTIDWGDGDTTPITGRSVLETHTYSAGTYSLTVLIDDGDGGTDSAGGTGNVSLLYTTSGFLQPINISGQRSGFKIGSTIPVKARITDCNGNTVTTLAPEVKLTKVDPSPDVPVNELISSSAADTGTTMRLADGFYIYNLSTKRSQFCPSSACSNGDLTQGTYRLRATDPTIATVEAFFDLRK